MTVRTTTQHDIQKDDENTSRPAYAVVNTVFITGSMYMTYTGVDPGTGKVTVYISGSGVTNGDAHDHNGGDGATIPTGGIADKAVTLAKLSDLSLVPGGRLTLTSTTPVTTTNVTGTSIIYTPYLHNIIVLWDGANWTPITFTEVSQALGTMVTGTPYDIFASLGGGALSVEKLAWTNATTRATAVTIQDGRYCKSGDKTRLYLGTLYSGSSATQTEDSDTRRFLWNMYNRVPRRLKIENSTSHNYNVATIRPFNNDQANSEVESFIGLVEDSITIELMAQLNRAATDGAPRIRFGVNSTNTEFGFYGLAVSAITGRITGGAVAEIIPSLGYSFYCITEFSTAGTAPGTSFEAAAINGVIQA